MSKHNRTVVVIQNPLAGGSRYTSQRTARDYVLRGIAIWSENETQIRFVHRSRIASVSGPVSPEQRELIARLKAIKNIPVIAPWKLLVRTSRRKRSAE